MNKDETPNVFLIFLICITGFWFIAYVIVPTWLEILNPMFLAISEFLKGLTPIDYLIFLVALFLVMAFSYGERESPPSDYIRDASSMNMKDPR